LTAPISKQAACAGCSLLSPAKGGELIKVI